MTWEAAMRWALIRARETGKRRRVYAVRNVFGGWAYAAGFADEDGCE